MPAATPALRPAAPTPAAPPCSSDGIGPGAAPTPAAPPCSSDASSPDASGPAVQGSDASSPDTNGNADGDADGSSDAPTASGDAPTAVRTRTAATALHPRVASLSDEVRQNQLEVEGRERLAESSAAPRPLPPPVALIVYAKLANDGVLPILQEMEAVALAIL